MSTAITYSTSKLVLAVLGYFQQTPKPDPEPHREEWYRKSGSVDSADTELLSVAHVAVLGDN